MMTLIGYAAIAHCAFNGKNLDNGQTWREAILAAGGMLEADVNDVFSISAEKEPIEALIKIARAASRPQRASMVRIPAADYLESWAGDQGIYNTGPVVAAFLPYAGTEIPERLYDAYAIAMRHDDGTAKVIGGLRKPWDYQQIMAGALGMSTSEFDWPKHWPD